MIQHKIAIFARGIQLILASYVVFVFSLTAQESSADKGPSVNLPLYHFAYDLLERLEVRGVIHPTIELRIRPITRNTVVRLIMEIREKLADDPSILSASDRRLFEKLSGEFHFELSQHGMTISEEESERHLFTLKHSESGSYAIADAVAEQAFDISRYNSSEDTLNDAVSFSRASGRVRGVLRGGIAFYSDFSSTLIRGSDRSFLIGENIQQGVVNFNPSSENVYSLNATAYLVFEPKWFRLQIGKDPVVIGPSNRSNFMLSDNAGSFDNLRMDVTFDRLKFTYLHGWLRSKPLVFDREGNISDRKYIVMHRLEFKVAPWLFVAGNESVIYGGRDIEFQYLNPIIPYHIAEQYLGDKDNNTISFDATAFAGGSKLYASIFLDDFTSSRNPFRYWKQTWAAMAGVFWPEPFGTQNLDMRFEYVRIEPYVYSHKFPLINYSHFASSLGSPVPPNSDDYFVEMQYRPTGRLAVGFTYELLRHGEGSIDRFGYEDGFVDAGEVGKQNKKFLQGINETKNILAMRFRWEVFRQQYFYLTAQRTIARNFENIRGRHSVQNYLIGGYKIDY